MSDVLIGTAIDEGVATMSPAEALDKLARVPVVALIKELRAGRLNRISLGGRVVLDQAATALLMGVTADRMAQLAEALDWYAEQTAGCRKLGRIGDPFRNALDKDGGKRARDVLGATAA